jgi:hypothetical protein
MKSLIVVHSYHHNNTLKLAQVMAARAPLIERLFMLFLDGISMENECLLAVFAFPMFPLCRPIGLR